ncbi:TRAP-type C4-dicarboxylate transport system substrate-binding protein [Roseibium hamelinense]|uniref:TRAP-type C4-dicarboxylate transport system substrate-binding protein n=1 Tax=Roseibium hamelinense TaxID=150831 RepID=A0A562T9S9_9HYPH|nr:TRAP transporter substrate-binding protein [Roseibium hamelinense]MTI45289.1 TRAP transporter substrate-binding protein [Roseibium hamelinense]TWI90345.1 TRAP-type C4-dicarboxylate transport system substrate-binding protein [Roseibium hamelinense]
MHHVRTTTFALTAVSAVALSLSAVAVKAEELVLSSWLPPKHPVVTQVMTPWAESVEEATEGRVTVRILPKPLGPPPAHYDLAADGIADITYGLHSFTKDDRFLRSRIGQFSFIGDTATDASKAYWDVYSGPLDAQEEHADTKLLGLFVHGPGMFHNNQRKIETPEDFSGLKIRTPGGYIAGLSQDLDITTQFMGPGEVYEKLSRGVIDGVTFPMEALQAFKLTDHIKYSMKVPGGIYNTSWFLVMNENRWDGLSDEDKAAIEKVSGAALAEMAGRVWDAADSNGASYVADTEIEVYDAPPAVVDAIRAIAEKREAEWAAAVQDTGFDGAAALAELRSQTGVSD